MRSRSIALILIASSTLAACSGIPVRGRKLDSGVEVSCIGPDDAEHFAIYLHGIDTVAPSDQEMHNRELLSDIAKEKKIRFALPRAQMTCPKQTDTICWGWKFDQAELASALPIALLSRTACFPEDKPFTMIGFSNGGYLLTSWYTAGMLPDFSPWPDAMVASGSGKGWITGDVKNFSKYPELAIVIGKQDKFNFDPDEFLFKQLQSRKAPVKLIEFDGGHELNKEALLKALSD